MNLKDNLYIKQIIPKTIQGEGNRIGYPSTLIRLSGCNLACSFCDSKYTWNIKKDDIIIDQKIYFEFIKKIKLYNMSNIMLTGGEPFLYTDNYLFWDLLCKFKNKIEIETNGSLLNNKNQQRLIDFGLPCKLNISPKLNKDFYKNKNDYINLVEYIKNFCSYFNESDFILKFVYAEKLEKEVLEFINKIQTRTNDNIYLMPYTPDMKLYDSFEKFNIDFRHSCQDTAKACIKYKFKYSPRSHIEIFGDDKDETFL